MASWPFGQLRIGMLVVELGGRLTCERMKMRGETGEESRYTRESSAVWGSMKRCPRWEETKSWCVCAYVYMCVCVCVCVCVCAKLSSSLVNSVFIE